MTEQQDSQLSSINHLTGSTADQADLSTITFGHGETILLADNNANLLKMGSTLLNRLNYQVVTANNEDQVIEQITASGIKIDLLILDTDIPGQHGPNIVDRIQSYQPQVKTLFYTVYDWLIDPRCREKIGRTPVITKPYSISELSRMIYHTLN